MSGSFFELLCREFTIFPLIQTTTDGLNQSGVPFIYVPMNTLQSLHDSTYINEDFHNTADATYVK
jgi:hypothetical protein